MSNKSTVVKKVTLNEIFDGMRQIKFNGMVMRNNPRKKELSFTLTRPNPFVKTTMGAARSGTQVVSTIDIIYDAALSTATWKYSSEDCAANAQRSGIHQNISALLGADSDE